MIASGHDTWAGPTAATPGVRRSCAGLRFLTCSSRPCLLVTVPPARRTFRTATATRPGAAATTVAAGRTTRGRADDGPGTALQAASAAAQAASRRRIRVRVANTPAGPLTQPPPPIGGAARLRAMRAPLLVAAAVATSSTGIGTASAARAPHATPSADPTHTYALPGPAVFPESVGVSKADHTFYVGSTGDGTVFKGSTDGTDATVFLPGGAD